jgi:hypothetical protein
MKYKVITTVNGRENGHVYETREAAVKTWNRLREVYTRAGYTIADAAGESIDRDGLAELWIREGRAARNIEIWPTADGETPATPADIESEAETITAAPAADSLAAKVADVARVWLLCCCLTAAAPAAADSIETDTPADVCELLTADPLAQVAEFAAAGLTVSHVTIKSLPARELPAADVPAMLTC